MRQRYRQGTANAIHLPSITGKPIDVFAIVRPPIFAAVAARNQRTAGQRSSPATIYWKCALSIPDTGEDAAFQRTGRWLADAFERCQAPTADCFFAEHQTNGRQSMAISMRQFIGQHLSNESGMPATKQDTAAVNAILFFMSSTAAATASRTEARLKAILDRVTTDAKNAVAIVLYDGATTEDIERICERLQLDTLLPMYRQTGTFHCVSATRAAATQRQLSLSIENGLRCVAALYVFASALEQQSTTAFLSHCLSDQFWARIEVSAHTNPGLYKAVRQPNFLVRLHNAAIDRLIAVCTPNIGEHPEFPQDLRQFVQPNQFDIPHGWQHFPVDWKQPHRYKQWHSFLDSVRLRTTTTTCADGGTDFASLQEALLVFAQQNVPCERNADVMACQMIACAVQHLQSFQANDGDDNDALTFAEKMQQFSWLPIVRLVTVELLTHRHREAVAKRLLPDDVIYDRQALAEYTNVPWWLQLGGLLKNVRVNVDGASKSVMADNEAAAHQKKRKVARIDDNELDAILKRSSAALDKADRFIGHAKGMYSDSKEITRTVDRLLYEQERDIRVTKRQWNMSMREE